MDDVFFITNFINVNVSVMHAHINVNYKYIISLSLYTLAPNDVTHDGLEFTRGL